MYVSMCMYVCAFYVLFSVDVYAFGAHEVVDDVQPLAVLDRIDVDVACNVVQVVLLPGRSRCGQRQAYGTLWRNLSDLTNVVTVYLVSDDAILCFATLVEVLQELLEGGGFMGVCWWYICPSH